MAGLFITFEGGEGAGKSTQIRLLHQTLTAQGRKVVLTREPGGSAGAEALRELILFSEAPLSLRAQALAHMAARADHLDHVILPALARGEIVLCDRFHDSTFVYQGYGLARGDVVTLGFINALRGLIDCEPDLTLLLTVPPEIGAARIAARGGKPDRYEAEKAEFHHRIAQGFADLARTAPARIRPVDATQSPEDVAAAILAIVSPSLPA
ncbi:dTMP kinase [Asaia sp. W19]|uniref:dTMP kinase n=1 Tax=unclassified Asaia TaxID=2685023 RepID=UPI000F8F7C9F|nr:dTMP kinase [Asaia sp. W19]RUT25798.1 dTMP kinase [Asaia sp. W19]